MRKCRLPFTKMLLAILLGAASQACTVVSVPIGKNEHNLTSIRVKVDIDKEFDARTRQMLHMVAYKDLTTLGYYVYPPLLSEYYQHNSEFSEVADAVLEMNITRTTKNLEKEGEENYVYLYRLIDTRNEKLYWQDAGIYKIKLRCSELKGHTNIGDPRGLVLVPIALLIYGLDCTGKANARDERIKQYDVISMDYLDDKHGYLIGSIKNKIPSGPYTIEHKNKVLRFDSDTMRFYWENEQ